MEEHPKDAAPPEEPPQPPPFDPDPDLVSFLERGKKDDPKKTWAESSRRGSR